VVENRKHPRVPSRLRCWCEGENVTVYARVGNISEGGMFVCTSTPLIKGAAATLRFGAESPVETPATVMWVHSGNGGGLPTGMGLRFEGLDEGRVEAIRRLIEGEQRAQKNH
jgi:uncharacterized protein (TIGR02266 family)